MRGFFINFTNHPSKYWEERQTKEAEKYGNIRDFPFPDVDPQKGEEYIDELARGCVEQIIKLHPNAVLCQGEFCLAYQVIKRLREKEIVVLAACSERIVSVEGQKKLVTFVFRRFRNYL